ncbi:MAG TPA: SRPBCC domain-containing protein [Trueperaceae bacterium]|nr:SRPBCC domain-containing protein [Trueperaceae bacterium]
MTVKINRKGSAKVEPVSETSYTITRQFDAKPDSLFKAMTQPQYIKRWWGFPDVEWLDCQADLRVGGYWRNSVRGEGYEVSFHGHYREIEQPRRLVQTEVYEGMPGGGPDVHEPGTLITTSFSLDGGVTTMHAHVECYTPETMKAVFESGMESGLQVSYDRIEELLPEIETR